MKIGKFLWRPVDFIGCLFFGPFFVGGEDADEVLRTGAKLKEQGYGVTYNLLGEHERSWSRILKARSSTEELIAKMDDTNRGNVAIKPTLYGLDVSQSAFFRVMESILELAMEKGVEVEIDAESRSTIQETFEVFSRFADRFPHRHFIRQCVQAHLVDIYELMDKYDLWDKNLRIVKGAGIYDEKPGTVLTDPEKIMEQYYHILHRNYSVHGGLPYVATMRDEELARTAMAYRLASYVRPYKFTFQMLYGPAGKRLRERLLKGGRPVRVYIPFVDPWCRYAWIGYGLRRASTVRGLIWEWIKKEADKMLHIYGRAGWEWH